MTIDVKFSEPGIFVGNVDSPGPKVPGKELDPAIIEQLEQLRSRTHEQMWQALDNRLSTNPTPTEEEVALGAFLEMIEPQVVEAVRTLYKKGYATNSSGFYGQGYQSIDGFMQLQENEIEILTSLGAIVKRKPGRGGYTFISILPEEVSLESIKEKWDVIANALPDRGHPAPITLTDGTQEFWDNYCDPLQVEKVRIENRLANHQYYDEEVRTELIERLNQITKE